MPCPLALPALLTPPCAAHGAGGPVKVVTHAATRLGLLPVRRRRMTACGVQPLAPVRHRLAHGSLWGAVEPPPGARVFLALPPRNRRTVQVWLEGFAAALPDSCHSLVRDKGAFHKVKALRGPPNVVPGCFPASSPALHPLDRLWRALKDQLAAMVGKTLEEWSKAMGAIIQHSTPAMRQSLPGLAYFVQALDIARGTTSV